MNRAASATLSETRVLAMQVPMYDSNEVSKNVNIIKDCSYIVIVIQWVRLVHFQIQVFLDRLQP
jgi:hypothetical protein